MMNITRRALLGSLACSGWAQPAAEQIWDPAVRLPKAAGLDELAGVRFSVIKKYEPENDGGYGFLHGVGLPPR